MNTNRKRSRWDESRREQSSNSNPHESNQGRQIQQGGDSCATTSTTDVPDDVALQALVQSAQAHQAAKEQSMKKKQSESKKESSHRWNNPHQRGRFNRHGMLEESSREDQSDYYGPSADGIAMRDGVSSTLENQKGESDAEVGQQPPEKPNFGLSGALAKDAQHGHLYKGVLLKFQEPPEARTPNTQWRLYVFKGDEQIDVLHISRQSAYLIGRNGDIADICVQHPSCSSQHAVLQYRAVPTNDGRLNCQPYIMDLESTNGTFLNGVQIDSARYYQVKKGDVLRFGSSTREYVLLTATTTKPK